MIGLLAVAQSQDVAHRVLEGALAQASGSQGFGSTAVFIALMLGIFYLLLWRPQQKQAKQHRAMLAGLKKGDVVVTGGGIIGKVHAVAEKFVTIETGRDQRMRVLLSSVSGKAPEGLLTDPENKVEPKSEKDAEKK